MSCRTIHTKIEHVRRGDVFEQGAHAGERVVKRHPVRAGKLRIDFAGGASGVFYKGVEWRVQRCAKRRK